MSSLKVMHNSPVLYKSIIMIAFQKFKLIKYKFIKYTVYKEKA